METIENRIITKLFRVNTETKEFIGFYDSEIHNLQPDNIELFELSEENWQALLNKQTSGEEIRILNQFDYSPETREVFIPNIGGYKKPPIPAGMVKAVFNYKEGVWEETATREEELIDARKQLNSELDLTERFETGAYRRRLSGEEITEIDSYRDQLLDLYDAYTEELTSTHRVNFSLTKPFVPNRPTFLNKFL